MPDEQTELAAETCGIRNAKTARDKTVVNFMVVALY